MRLASALLAVAVSAASVHADPAPEKVTRTDPGATRRTAATWTLVGAGGLFLSSVVLGLYEKHAYDDDVARGDVAGANHAVVVARYGGTGLFAAGVVAAGVAVYLRVTAPEKHTIVTPAVAPGQVGLALTHSF